MARPNPYAIGPSRLAVRLLATLLLMLAIYNPSGRSYVHWITSTGSGPLPLQIGVGLLLICGIVVLVRLGTAAVGRAPFFLGLAACGLFGAGLGGAVPGAFDPEIAGYGALAAIAVWLTLGLSWPYLSRRLSGQSQTRKV